ncbi:MAG: TraB/GumN family protein [Pseudomonadota bacterium]
MKLRALFPTAAAALALFSAGCAYPNEEAASAAAEPAIAEAEEVAVGQNGPAMWQVADEDTTLYIFGTIHMLPDTVEWYSGDVKTALESSDTLVTEIDMTPENMASLGTTMAQLGTLPEGQTLRGLMNDDQRAKYEGGLAKLNIPPEAFDTMEPWFASLAMTQIIAGASGFTPDKGVEFSLEDKISPDVKRAALETFESQLAAFDEMPIDAQMAFLIDGAEDPLEGIEILNQLVDLWAAGKVDELADLMNDGFETNPILAERLLYNRNQAWAGWIEERLDTPGTVFIAAGALHFAGEKSVQDYLSQRGIKTKRVQ